jgi:hypothetical protein
MKKQFSLERNIAVINFSSYYCDTSEKLLNSKGFERVLDKYVNGIKEKNTPIYQYLRVSFNHHIERNLIQLFKLLLVSELDEIKKFNHQYKMILDSEKIKLLIEFVEEFYNYWRKISTLVREFKRQNLLSLIRTFLT